MNPTILIYLICGLFSAISVEAESMEFYQKSVAWYACSYQVLYSTDVRLFGPTDYPSLCASENSRATIAGCLEYKNRYNAFVDNYIINYCKENFNVTLQPDWHEVALNDYNQRAQYVKDIPMPDGNITVNVPVKYEPDTMNYYAYVANTYLLNFDDSIYYGAAIFGFWLVVLIIHAVSHWSKILFPGFIRNSTGPITNFWRRFVFMPALIGKRKSQSMPGFVIFDSLIPARFDMIAISIFYILTLIFHTINMDGVANDPVFGSKYEAELRYVADRTGIVGTMIMPLVFLFSGRNNFLQWVCGINQATFLCYHRHIARVMFILVVIHSVVYTVAQKSVYSSSIVEPWFYWGVIGTIVGGVMLMQSILYLRRHWYECFLIVHILLAVFWIVGTWIHIIDFGYGDLLYPCIAVWCFDRLIRICRLFYFGTAQATLTLAGEDTIRMTIPKPKHWSIVPGGHAFVYFMCPSYFWQSHPFTFSNSSDSDTLVFYMKVKRGVTKNFYNLLNKAPGRTITVRVGVEGPYGESSPAKYSDKAVFLAGGNGIPGILSEVYDISLKSSKERKSILKLVWVVREYSSIVWFYDELSKLKSTNIDTTIYVTRPEANLDRLGEFDRISSSKEDSINEVSKSKEYITEDIPGELKGKLSHIHFEEGRPNIEKLIQDEIKESPGSTFFVACGHPIMVDEVRYQCCKNIDNPEKKRVDFFEQLQVWA
ncbi:uncharacterized protein SPAPADRAFT_64626 [Spathaspora passalidarum NRRL Y-27907]|uniref:ferric-chelate reductase (NADPH) n=1 Tax=Spathaspora passalidarum (strain NRRL Y-27907 / 11-Y1) TaxID=619300 RepID=G3AH85_SPAPN|nr:uncharacterized protein SPAPADRAFT_64626 [Spathaspora passalidarum NRRL Y-27907]EGW35515.1 hypothetical protein SPAPADRAFT_64626 [Spathaspora passalidarum NRRL Y-27907]